MKHLLRLWRQATLWTIFAVVALCFFSDADSFTVFISIKAVALILALLGVYLMKRWERRLPCIARFINDAYL